LKALERREAPVGIYLGLNWGNFQVNLNWGPHYWELPFFGAHYGLGSGSVFTDGSFGTKVWEVKALNLNRGGF